MAYIEGEDRYQQMLFPDSIEAYIDDDSPVRVIDAFVMSLDMLQLGFIRGRAAETGRPGYDPRDLLKLYLYGYLNGLRSSRTLAWNGLSVNRKPFYAVLLCRATANSCSQQLLFDNLWQ